MKSTLMALRLIMRTPGGVTAPESQRFDDPGEGEGASVRNVLPIRRDPSGTPHLPGSTVAGSLKAHCAALGLGDWFGSEPGDDERVASSVQVLGTRLIARQDTQTRTRTAIDRHRGAPAERTLHTVEQLPAGTTFDIMLRWDGASDDDLRSFRNAVVSWAPTLGRGTSLGAGRAGVTGFGMRTFDLGSVDGLMSWLDITGPDSYPKPDVLDSSSWSLPVLRSVEFEIVEALHVGSGRQERAGDGHHVSLISRAGDDYVLPGSSIKGVLRSRAEYICRVLGLPACAGSARPTCDASRPCRTCRLFGRGASSKLDSPRRALVAIPDAVITAGILEHRQHVAIDRFTGGACPSLLYTDEVLVKGQFTIVVEALVSGVDAGDLALLDAVLTDLHDGLIGFGSRTTAGYGTVRVADPGWHPPNLGELANLLGRAA